MQAEICTRICACLQGNEYGTHLECLMKAETCMRICAVLQGILACFRHCRFSVDLALAVFLAFYACVCWPNPICLSGPFCECLDAKGDKVWQNAKRNELIYILRVQSSQFLIGSVHVPKSEMHPCMPAWIKYRHSKCCLSFLCPLYTHGLCFCSIPTVQIYVYIIDLCLFGSLDA